MKEIKAYIRTNLINSTVEALEQAGARDMTIIRVDAMGVLSDYERNRRHLVRKYAEAYSSVAKIEIICRDAEENTLVELIRQHACTGERGDGRIFVSDIARAVNIRTGKEGEEAL